MFKRSELEARSRVIRLQFVIQTVNIVLIVLKS